MPGPGSRALEPVRRGLGVVSALLMLAVLVGYAAGAMGARSEDLGELAAALLAAVSCGLTARLTGGRLRSAWSALAIACLAWAVGEAIWSYYDLVLGDNPFPSVADLGFLGFPVGAVLALELFPGGGSPGDSRRRVLDGVMVATALGLISWATSLGAVVEAGGDSPLATGVSVAYPATDVALLMICVVVFSRSTSRRAPLACIAGGLALMAFSDSAFAYLTAEDRYGVGSPVDLGWFFAFGLLALAPLTPGALREEVEDEGIVVAGGLLAYLPLAGALAFVGWREITGHPLSR
ncbi:MAG: hypothetical protein JWN31_1842, partial [Frankiales bacterium]|nr:hypothetical protein [Frankiales bacterium]